MQEIFKPVENYEGLYEISNLGRVRSLHKATCNKSNILCARKHHRYNYTSASILLNKKGKGKETQISRLVAQAFIPNPENKPFVNHLDNDATNNIYTNLEWVTHRENVEYAYKQGRYEKKLYTGCLVDKYIA